MEGTKYFDKSILCLPDPAMCQTEILGVVFNTTLLSAAAMTIPTNSLWNQDSVTIIIGSAPNTI